jgi:hypothetical protein
MASAGIPTLPTTDRHRANLLRLLPLAAFRNLLPDPR